MANQFIFDDVVDHLECILDYYTQYRACKIEELKYGSTILEGLVHSDPFVVCKAYKAAKLYIEKFNNQELH